MVKYFAGIGSREIPSYYQPYIDRIVKILVDRGFGLRSGGASGSDTFFEESFIKHAPDFNTRMQIFLPYDGFNGRRVDDVNYICSLEHPSDRERLITHAKKFHPKWDRLGDGGQKLMARNSQQVCGAYLHHYSEFIVCYTEYGNGGGGTGQALRIADQYNIPIFDIGKYYTGIVDPKRVDVDYQLALDLFVEDFLYFLDMTSDF